MPELPEVETIRRSLLPLIRGKTVAALATFTGEVLENPDSLELEGRKLEDISRKGKYLLFHFPERELLVHLRMTGKLLYQEEASPPGRFTRARLLFTDGSALAFDDIRRFGRWKLFPGGEAGRDRGYAALGPDLLDPSFSEEDFLTRIKRHKKTPIKAALLDQSVLAGLGNIYADESLFLAGIHPALPVEKLSKARLKRLFRVICDIIPQAVGLGGTSFSDYVDGLGKKGNFQLVLKVYQREGQACPNCGRPLKKCLLAGRGTRFCPFCQRR